ncbi:hypothetical protein FGB62_55g137 [Gracilaria domingensis]|nr:hypothetical protein FGB62_55g137 [Gracilaria domingensis]
MQRHPSGCDPRAFRGRNSLNIPHQNARKRRPYDPVLETLPGMQTALGELERSGPSLYRGTIERSNLNRLANDLTEILVRHVNRIRFQSKIASQSHPNHANVAHEEPMVPRKRARPARYIEESDRPDSRFNAPSRRPHRLHVNQESRGFPHRRSLPQDLSHSRPQRKRRLVRYASSEESDDDDVREVHRMERPRRSKEIRRNLNDDMAYEYMEKAAREREEERRRQREVEEAEKQDAMSVDDSSEDDDDLDFVPKIVCPKPYVRERALQSDFASMTPIITDPDDDTDTEHYRKWNARRTKKTVHDDNKTVHLERKQCQIFPVGRKTRLVRDVVVNTELMRALAKMGQHHKHYKSILRPLPNIPVDCLQPGGRHWKDFGITEAFRKAPTAPLFHAKVAKQHRNPITPDKNASLSTNTPNLSNATVEHKSGAYGPKDLAQRSGGILAMMEANASKKAVNGDPEVSSIRTLAREQSSGHSAPPRRLNGLNQTLHEANPLLNQREQRKVPSEPSNVRTGTSATVGLPGEDSLIKKMQKYKPISPRPMPTMRQDVGRNMSHTNQQHSSSVTQRTDGVPTQAVTGPNVLYPVRSNAFQQSMQLPYNHQMVLSSNQSGSSQMNALYRQPPYPAKEQRKQTPSTSAAQQTSAIAQITPGQRYLLPAGSQRRPSKEEIQAYQVMLQRGLVPTQLNPQLLQIQAFQEWQRQVRIQSLQQQQILQRQLQQRQQILMQSAPHSITPQAQQVPLDNQRITDHRPTRQFRNETSAVRESGIHQQSPIRDSEKSVNIATEAKSGIEDGLLDATTPLRSSYTDMNGRQSSLVLPDPATGSFSVQDRQTAQPPAPSFPGNRPSSLKAQRLSQTSNAFILPDSEVDLDAIVRGSRSERKHNAKKQRSEAPRNVRRMVNEVSTTAATPADQSEVQVVKTRPPVAPDSSVRGVPGWQWERLDYLMNQTNGLNTVQDRDPESNATNIDRSARDSFRDHQRQYQEDYRAQYELQLRKVMEEIRKKSGRTSLERE